MKKIDFGNARSESIGYQIDDPEDRGHQALTIDECIDALKCIKKVYGNIELLYCRINGVDGYSPVDIDTCPIRAIAGMVNQPDESKPGTAFVVLTDSYLDPTAVDHNREMISKEHRRRAVSKSSKMTS